MFEGLVRSVRFGAEKRLKFYAMLRDRARDRIPVYETLEEVHRMALRFNNYPPKVIGSILHSLRGGDRGKVSLAGALKSWVDPMEVMIVSAAERSGRLDVGLDEATRVMEVRTKLAGIVRGELIAPLFYLVALLTVLTVVSAVAIPAMEQAVPRAQWPWNAQILAWLAGHTTHITAGTLGILGGWLVLFLVTAGRWTGELRGRVDFLLPPWTIYRELQGAIFLNVMAMMARSGVPAVDAVRQLKAYSNTYMRFHMDEILMRMRRGEQEAAALAGDGGPGTLYRSEVAAFISFYGRSASLTTAMSSLAKEQNDRLASRLATQMGVLRYGLQVLVAIVLVLGFSSFVGVAMSIKPSF